MCQYHHHQPVTPLQQSDNKMPIVIVWVLMIYIGLRHLTTILFCMDRHKSALRYLYKTLAKKTILYHHLLPMLVDSSRHPQKRRIILRISIRPCHSLILPEPIFCICLKIIHECHHLFLVIVILERTCLPREFYQTQL